MPGYNPYIFKTHAPASSAGGCCALASVALITAMLLSTRILIKELL